MKHTEVCFRQTITSESFQGKTYPAGFKTIFSVLRTTETSISLNLSLWKSWKETHFLLELMPPWSWSHLSWMNGKDKFLLCSIVQKNKGLSECDLTGGEKGLAWLPNQSIHTVKSLPLDIEQHWKGDEVLLGEARIINQLARPDGSWAERGNRQAVNSISLKEITGITCRTQGLFSNRTCFMPVCRRVLLP